MHHQRLLGIAKYAISGGLVALVLDKIPLRPMLAHVHRVDLLLLGASILINFLLLWMQALRWKILMPNSRASLRRLYAWCVIGAAAGSVMPSSVGGDTLKAILLGKEESAMGASVASTIMGRAFGLMALGCICLGGAILWPPLHSLISPRRLVLLSAALAIGGLTVFALSKGNAFLGKFWRLRAGKVSALLQHFSDTVRSPGRMFLTAILSILLQTVSILNGWLLFLACGVHVPLAAACALLPIVMLGTMAPISIGGVGVREGLSAALFLRFAGIPPTASVTANIIGYTSVVAIGLAGALCWAFLRPKTPSLPEKDIP